MAKSIKKTLQNFTPEELPELLMPHIELCSDIRAVVDGCSGILEYSGEFIKLNCKTKTVAFSGFNLSLCTLCNEQITVTGKITEVSISS